MTAQQYLSQAQQLDTLINSMIKDLSVVKSLSTGLSSPGFGGGGSRGQSTNAPFVYSLERAWKLERKTDEKIDKLIQLREQISNVIDSVDSANERAVLRYRYLHGYTWEKIGEVFSADESTIRRWHRKALDKVVLPPDYIVI